jgi:predicted secreted Zn-dependent protease
MRASNHKAGLRRLATALLVLLPVFGVAEAASVTEYRFHPVSGTTPAELVADMRAHPVPTDDAGTAFAAITDRYEILLDTRQTRAACTVVGVSVDFRFTITLPQADEDRLDPHTRSLWRDFVAFSRRHEEGHRDIFLDCARAFEAEARRMRSAEGCPALRRQVVEAFDQRYAACMRRQADYDRRESDRLSSVPLFRAAR